MVDAELLSYGVVTPVNGRLGNHIQRPLPFSMPHRANWLDEDAEHGEEFSILVPFPCWEFRAQKRMRQSRTWLGPPRLGCSLLAIGSRIVRCSIWTDL